MLNGKEAFRYLWAFACLLLWGSNAIAQPPTQEKKQLPPANWMRARTIDIKHIAIDLRFDWVKKQASGTTAITLVPLHTTQFITLDAGMLTIKAITLANGAPLKFVYDGSDKNDALAITLDRPYQAREVVTVKIAYHTNWVNQLDPNTLGGSNGKGLRFSAPTSNDPTKPREIWSMGEPESNRYWFPSYDAPDDLRTTEFTATVDQKQTVISNGILTQTTDHPDGTRTFHWKTDTPYANHLTAFVIGEYIDIKQTYSGITLHNFSYPHETAATAASVERLPDMMKFFSERIGVRFPYPSYAQVFVQDSAWGVGNYMLASQSENMVDDDRTHADFLYLWDGLEGDTLAQQWFGGYLTTRDWSHLWLNKAFGRYFSGLYNEYKNGRAEFLLYHHSYDQSVYLSDWAAGSRQPIITKHYANAVTLAADNYPLSRGALVLHMLRKHLGEANWWKAIQHYVKANAHRAVTTEDFRRAIEAATDEPMDWFFEQWLYKMGHPIFEVTKQYDPAKKALVLLVRQTQKVDPQDDQPQVEYFQGKIDIRIDGRIETVWCQPKAENVFTFGSAEQPKLVNFDYEGTWIKEVSFAKPTDELLYQLQHDSDVMGQRWALNELVNLAQSDKFSVAEKARIYSGLRSVIQSESYWRLRLNAINQLQRLLVVSPTSKPVLLDAPTIEMLLAVIRNERAWLRAAAINFLGMTRDPRFADIYLSALNDESDRVIYNAAIALGKTKHPNAFAALIKLKDKPSWKNQSLIATLNGLKELGDPRGSEVALHALSDLKLLRWRLPTQLWDFRITATETIVALGQSAIAYPLLRDRCKTALAENDTIGVFNNVLLIATLHDPRGKEVFDWVKAKYQDDSNALKALQAYEQQFTEALKQSAR